MKNCQIRKDPRKFGNIKNLNMKESLTLQFCEYTRSLIIFLNAKRCSWLFVCVPVCFDGARMQGKTMIEQIGVCHATRA